MHQYYEWLAATQQQGGVLTFTWRAVPLNARQRKDLASLVSAPKSGRVAAHALVTDSRPVQMVLKAMDWFVTKPYPEQVFIEPLAALEWMQMHVALDRTAIVDAILRDVPVGQRDLSLGQFAHAQNRG